MVSNNKGFKKRKERKDLESIRPYFYHKIESFSEKECWFYGVWFYAFDRNHGDFVAVVFSYSMINSWSTQKLHYMFYAVIIWNCEKKKNNSSSRNITKIKHVVIFITLLF